MKKNKTIMRMVRVSATKYWLKLECGHIVEKSIAGAVHNFSSSDEYKKYCKARCTVCNSIEKIKNKG